MTGSFIISIKLRLKKPEMSVARVGDMSYDVNKYRNVHVEVFALSFILKKKHTTSRPSE